METLEREKPGKPAHEAENPEPDSISSNEQILFETMLTMIVENNTYYKGCIFTLKQGADTSSSFVVEWRSPINKTLGERIPFTCYNAYVTIELNISYEKKQKVTISMEIDQETMFAVETYSTNAMELIYILSKCGIINAVGGEKGGGIKLLNKIAKLETDQHSFACSQYLNRGSVAGVFRKLSRRGVRLTSLDQWQEEDVYEWLSRIYFFEMQRTPFETSTMRNKKKSRVIEVPKVAQLLVKQDIKTLDTAKLWSLEEFSRDLSPYQMIQLQAEIEAVQRAGHFNQRRRAVFENLYQYSSTTASECMKQAEILCNPRLIRENYLNIDTNGERKYEVSLIVATLTNNTVTKTIASLFHRTPLFPSYGIYHTALRIGPWIIDWNNSSVSMPRPYSKGLTNALLEYSILDTLDVTKPQEKERLEDLLVVLSNVMAKYNSAKTYAILTRNCQHFLEEFLRKSGIQPHPEPAIASYLADIKSTCSPKFQFNADALIFSHRMVIQQMTMNKTLSSEFSLPSPSTIVFNNYEVLNVYFSQMSHYCKDSEELTFERKFPGEYKLLLGFCKALCLRQNSLLHYSRVD